MSEKRFRNSGADSELMAHAQELEIKFLRFRDGKLHGSFEIRGCFGADLDEVHDPISGSDPREAMDFAARLTDQFQRGRHPEE